jgi:RHS repeat-associated protein
VPSISSVPWSHETRYEDVARRRLSLDALGRTTTQELDGLGRVVREIDADGKDRLFTYDGVNKRSETDKRPEHHVTTFAYDTFDRLVSTVHPELDGVPGPFTSTTVYQDATNARVDTDRRGIATTTRMDPLGRTREVARGDALVERHTYDGNGNRLTSLDAEERATAFEYDAANRLVRRTDGVGTANESSITYTPDANGNVLEERDARAVLESQPFSVKRTYDELNRPETVTDGLLHTAENGWDPEGNQIRLKHPEGNELHSAYDELAKLTQTTEPPAGPGTGVTRHTYDANRNRTEQEDARSNAVEMQYDELGRLTAMVQPGGLTTARDYDANGNVLVLTDPKGQTVTSTYDEWNRLKTKVYAFAPGDTYRPWRWIVSIAYHYDANDNVLRIEETVASGSDPPPSAPNQVTTRTYDDFDRMLSEQVTLPDGGTKTVSYTYFKNGNRKTVMDPAGIVTHYTYDGQNRLETMTTPEGVTTYTYWPDDLLKTVTYPSGVVSSYGYDLADRLTSLESRQGATVVSSYAYTYDANGNRLSQTETNGGPPETTTYSYDARDRLETVTYPPDEISATGRVVTYTYDEVGNRLTELTTDPVSGDPIASKSGTFDALNRLTVLTDELDGPQTVTFVYDDNGNQTAKTVGAPGGPGVTTAFRYDVRDKLVEVETPTAIAAQFQHDADGRLSKKIGEDGIRQYVYDEDSRFLEYDTAGLQVAKYSYGADRLISLVRADEGTRFYHLDGLGSVTTLTDPSGAVTSRLHLDAWGVFRNPDEMNGPGASKNRFAFTGYVFDRETELYFAKARFYDPTVGRFTSQDSFLGEIDAPPSLHRYFYANANPLFFVDPTGHEGIAARARRLGRVDESILGLDQQGRIGQQTAPKPTRETASAEEVDLSVFPPDERKVLREGSPEAVARYNRDRRPVTLKESPGAVDTEIQGCGGDQRCYDLIWSQRDQRDAFKTFGKAGAEGGRELISLGAGTVGDVHTAVTGVDIGTEERVGAGGRILAAVAAVTPMVSHSDIRLIEKAAEEAAQARRLAQGSRELRVLKPHFSPDLAKVGVREFDVVAYGAKAPGFEKHHGVLDVWAKENVPGYVSRAPDSTALALSPAAHDRTKAVFRDWLEARTGKRVGGQVDWKQVSPREVHALSERMFDAAKVPPEARDLYYRRFSQHIYEKP